MNNPIDGPAWQSALLPLSIIRMLWKQKLMVLTVWLLLTVVAVVGVVAMPAIYRAETLVLVDSQKIPEKFVSTTVSADLRERLASLSQQILSSSHLLKIIQTFDLYPDERRRSLPVEDVLEMMRRDISIRVEKGWTDQHPGAFRVSFEGKDPAILAEVANQLGNLFVDEDLRARELHAADTQEFIQSQLEQAKKSLDEQEKHVSQYKLEHNGELPEQESALTASLSQLSVQLQGNQDAISRCYANQVTLQSGLRLSQAVADVSERLNTRQQETLAAGGQGRQASEQRPEDILPGLETELASLLTHYTEAHPRVRLLRASIARLKALEQREQLAAAVDPQHTESLKAQLAAVDQELKERQQENQRLIQEVQAVRSRLRKIPVREQEMAGLTREYEMSKANYKSLQDKLYAAEMAADLERRQKAERFTILEPARVPERAVKPNRPVLASLGCLVALLGAVIVGLAREFKKNTVLGEWEVPATTPVQGRVPTIGARKRVSPSVRLRLQAQSGVGRLLSPVMNEGVDGGHSFGGLAMPMVREEVHSVPTTQLSQTQARNRHLNRQVSSVRSTSAAICLHNADPVALEQYRIARTKIAYHPLQPKLVVVTSACAGDGKTISAINLATVFALRTDVRVLLVDADFRRSCVADHFGIPAGPGIADVLSGKCELSEAIVSLEQLPNLCVLPAGSSAANPAELLETPAWHSMCRSLREQFAIILFDAPPVAAVADYELIEKNCDGVLMVVRPDHTDRNLFRMAHGFVSPAKMLGVLMNGTDDWFMWKVPEYYYGYSRVRS